jgi:predicted ATPase with chaperone activity
LMRLGPAINSGRGLFLYGAPGNGKTSIAERITKAFGEFIWIPRAIGIDGEIMRLFDPGMHEEMPLSANQGLIDQRTIDQRWVRIRRPTIVVGGELTMDQLEVTLNTATNVSESPVQMKSNCGTLVIDDFGRQKMTTDQLLNRWIVPLEKRYDFLNLASGKKIQVPFDQLIVFSTNLEPKQLVDDAFLRRIPYKIEVTDPTEEAFRDLLKIMAPKVGVEYDEAAVDHLIEKHYKSINRPFRCCQPRDLLLQIRNYCSYIRQPAKMTPESLDFAVQNYFAVM